MTHLLLLAMGFACAAQTPNNGEKKEMDNLEGSWIVVNEASLRKGEKWMIAGGRIREGEDDKLYRFYKLAPDKKPKEIDVHVMGQKDGAPLYILRGIYSLEGERLKVHFASLDNDRPAAFPSEESRLTPMLILKRQKP